MGARAEKERTSASTTRAGARARRERLDGDDRLDGASSRGAARLAGASAPDPDDRECLDDGERTRARPARQRYATLA